MACYYLEKQKARPLHTESWISSPAHDRLRRQGLPVGVVSKQPGSGLEPRLSVQRGWGLKTGVHEGFLADMALRQDTVRYGEWIRGV